MSSIMFSVIIKVAQNIFVIKPTILITWKKLSVQIVFIDSVMQPVRYLARHTSSLILNVDSNIVESFNSIFAKLIGGKRINFVLKGSYAGRCAIATVTKNFKRPFYSLHKTISKNSPIGKLSSVKMKITLRNIFEINFVKIIA